MPLTMPASDPAITVIVAVWDAYVTEGLPEALASLQLQDEAFDLVLIDNRSAVPVAAPPQAKLVQAPRRLPLGAARNLGLQHATTPYVLFWDADDLMLPGTLARLRGVLEAEPHLVAVAMGIVDSSGARYRWPRPWITWLLRWQRAFRLLHCVWSLYPTTGATLIRTTTARDAGGFTEADIGDDWVFGVSLLFRGHVAWSEEPGRIYRRHAGSVWDRHRGIRSRLQQSRDVRRRLRVDSAVPNLERALLPVMGCANSVAVLVGHPVADLLRRLRYRAPRAG